MGADAAPQVMGSDKKPTAVSRVTGMGSVVPGPKYLLALRHLCGSAKSQVRAEML